MAKTLTEPDSQKKGKLFEQFFETCVLREGEFEVIFKHARSSVGEVDYVLRHNLNDSFWRLSPYVCIECKNWSKKVSSVSIDHFISLVRNSLLSSIGVFLTTNEIENSAKETAKNARLRDRVLIVTLEKSDLHSLLNQGFRKYVKTKGEEWSFKDR